MENLPQKSEFQTGLEAVADLLQRARLARNLTFKKVAEQLFDILGYKVSYTSVQKWESRFNPQLPSEDKINAISEIYGISTEEIKAAIEKFENAKNIQKSARLAPKSKPATNKYGGYDIGGSTGHRVGPKATYGRGKDNE